jgi:hypothetical protein
VTLVDQGSGSGPGASPATWVVMAASAQDLSGLDSARGWQPLPSRSVTWTDDYSSVLRVLR